jgi:hypothetical protein
VTALGDTIGTRALIPDGRRLSVRLNPYRRLADLEDERETAAFGAEMADTASARSTQPSWPVFLARKFSKFSLHIAQC